MGHFSSRRWYSALLAVFLLIPLPGLAETITDFSVSASVAQNRHLTIQEAITYDFGDAEKHGIFRDIPVSYDRNGGTYKLRLNVESVAMDGKSEPYSTSENGGVLEVKIGDANKMITGSHVYIIQYSTDRAINFFPDGHSELYWNVTGNDWPVDIEHASFALTTPQGMAASSVSSTCFTGEFGSTEQSCDVMQTANGFTAETKRVLLENEGFTVVFGFPAGAITPPTLMDSVLQFLSDNSIFALPIIAFFVMLWMWWTKGRDPRRRTVIPEYEPPQNLTPAEIGCAMTENGVPSQAVTATIIDLARRGYLHIRFGEDKKLFGTTQTFTFVKQKEADAVLSPGDEGNARYFEGQILSGLFKGGSEQTIDDLKKNTFYVSVEAFKRGVAAAVDKMGVFAGNPTAVRGGYIATAFIIGFGLTFFTSTFVETMAAVLTGVVIAVFGWFMPKRTDAGVKLLADIEGFKWFLSVTEKDRLAFTDAPERTPEQFNRFLPYAIVFGVEKQWATQFASLNIPPPNWAEGNIYSWNAVMLASNLSELHRSASSSAFAAPSQAGSGGSGFSGGGSGGGFGGGGGGSW